MPQTSYDFEERRVGLLSRHFDARLESLLNPKVAEVWTAVVGGTAANGIYSFKLREEIEDAGFLVSFDRQAAEDDDAIAAALQADGDRDELANIAVFTVATDTVTITGVQLGVPFELIDPTAPGAGTLVVAQTVSSVGVTIPIGRALVRSAVGEGRLPQTGDAATAIMGFGAVNSAIADNTGDPNDIDGWLPGAMITVNRANHMFVETEDAVTAGNQVFVRVVATGIEKFGVVRSDADGTDAVAINAEFTETTTGAGVVEILPNLPRF